MSSDCVVYCILSFQPLTVAFSGVAKGGGCMPPRPSWKLACVSGPQTPPGLCPWTPLGDFRPQTPRPPLLSPRPLANSWLRPWLHSTKRLIIYRNIAQFVTHMDAILDTPSKKSLWTFLIPRLNVNQQNYVKQYAELPRHNRSHGQLL